jgi:glycosyltransferase involved in cell wall biosynthesis
MYPSLSIQSQSLSATVFAPPDGALLALSLIVVVRNGARALAALLLDIARQDFPTDRMELILVDGGSTDGTRAVIEEFVRTHPHLHVLVLDNPGRILASGWNLALRHARGRASLRLDAHSMIPPGFVRANVERSRDEAICGGYLEALEPRGVWERLVFLADSSRFGGSAAAFRNPGAARYVDSVAYATYRREVFAVVGGFDERLVRNQDNEMHHRLRKAGFKFFFDPIIHAYYKPRASFKALLQQKYGNGYWVGLTLGISPGCFGLRHLVPGLFVMALLMAIVWLCWQGATPWGLLPLVTVLAPYGLLATHFALQSARKATHCVNPLCVLLPALFLMMHMAYGLGTLAGLVIIPFFLYRHRGYMRPWPVEVDVMAQEIVQH